MISIIVPVYNTEKYLQRCIDSILAQTFTDYELLLINDGSKDNSGTICEEYAKKDSRIRVVHKENGGTHNARCTGVSVAKGEYITFIDSDDEYIVNALEILTKHIEENVDIIVSETQKEEYISSETFIKNILTHKIWSTICCRLIKRTLFSSYLPNINRKILIGEDQLMNIKLTLGKELRIKCIKDVVYIYHQNMDSVTNVKKFTLEYEELFMQERLIVLNKYTPIYQDELHFNNLKTLENLIVCKVSVPYNREWVRDLITWGKGQKLGLRLWIVLNVRHNLLCKYILAIEKRIRNIYSKVFQ